MFFVFVLAFFVVNRLPISVKATDKRRQAEICGVPGPSKYWGMVYNSYQRQQIPTQLQSESDLRAVWF